MRTRTILTLAAFVLIAGLAAALSLWLVDRSWQKQAAITPGPAVPGPTTTRPEGAGAPMPILSPTTTPTLPPTSTPAPLFGPITFGSGLEGAQLIGTGTTFPSGTAELHAQWSYEGMATGLTYRIAWFLDDALWTYQSLAWDAALFGSGGPAYTTHISEHDADGLPPGHYRLELSIGDRLTQVATCVILGPLPTPIPPTTTPHPDLQEIGRRASRSLVALGLAEGYASLGSGSIVDGDQGLILTAWHVVADERGNLPSGSAPFLVSLTVDPDLAPVPTYLAEVLPEFSRPELDLALLRITHSLSGRRAVQPPLGLSAIPLGKSDDVRRGDRVLLLGYPDYAEGTLSWTEDVIVTRTADWIKSSAEASYGHSGGMMLNSHGELIGVITRGEPIGVQGQLTLAVPISAASTLVQRAIAGVQFVPTAQPPSRPPAREAMVVLAAPALHLRTGPGTDYSSVTTMPMGTVVDVRGDPDWDGERFWYPVRLREGGLEGWASGVYLASWEVARTPILFTSDRAGSLDIWWVYPDGTGLERLTDDPGDEGDPSWSADRVAIVYTCESGGNSDLCLMDLESGGRQLTSGPANDVHPVCSPVGAQVAFVSDRDGDWEIYLLDLDTGRIEQLTHNGSWDSFPAWSPDGRRIAFTSARTGNYDLFLVDVGTGVETQLTFNAYSDAHPAWSPVTDAIAYTLVLREGNTLLRELGVVSPYDPAHPRRLTQSRPAEALFRYPDWSPDGRWLVFESERDGDKEIYIMPAGGGLMANLSRSPGSSDTGPAWGR